MTHNNETPRERLDRLRVEVAQRRAELDETAAVPIVEAGDTIHCVDPGGVLLPRSVAVFGGEPGMQLFRGDTVTVREEWIEASRDASGALTWPSWVHDPHEQIRRWGRVRLAPGAFPADVSRYEPGTANWAAAREEARQAAWREPGAERRAAALAEVAREFGPPPVTSVTLNTAPDPSVRQAEEQRARLDAAGVKFHMHVEAREAGVQR